MIFTIGLAFILAGWLAQFYHTTVRKDPGLSRAFLVLYSGGCVLLALGNFLGNEAVSGILNLVVAILAIALLITVSSRIH